MKYPNTVFMFTEFSTTANLVLARMIEWFSANMLVLKLEKTNIMRFVIKTLPYSALTNCHKDKYILVEEAVNLIFLGIYKGRSLENRIFFLQSIYCKH